MSEQLETELTRTLRSQPIAITITKREDNCYIGVTTFFPPIFPAKQQGIHA